MKRLFLFLCVMVFAVTIFSNELIHNYYGDFHDVVRVVFVFRTQIHHNAMMDTDNKQIVLNFTGTKLNDSLFKLSFDDQWMFDDIRYEQEGNDLKVTMNMNVVYFAQCFTLTENVYKVVVDVYRQKEPTTVDQAKNYITFYRTVGYLSKANALQRRVNNNDFIVPITATQSTSSVPTTPAEIPTPPPPPPTRNDPPSPPPTQTSQNVTPQMPQQTYSDASFRSENLFAYIKPNTTNLTISQVNWINEAFRYYDIFKEIRLIIENAESTLRLYDSQKTIDISFLEKMSLAHNSFSDAQIKLNEIKLTFSNLLNNKNFTSTDAIIYTDRMMNHVLSVAESYRLKIIELQTEYSKRINR
ncbi:MAG: hypothetical protein FWG20_04500 [Candidatus Cloacimonetes bacterium]|nr:hypothetical protein [Candidatus Cloacimonadota bacterium]